MQAHLKNMKELTDKLAAIDAPISEEDQVVTLLGSLPRSYSTLVTALEARENVSFSYVQQSLIHEEQKLNGEFKQQSTSVEDQNSSALVGGQPGNSQRWKPRWKPKCYDCGELGHVRRDCPNSAWRQQHKAKPAGMPYSDSEPGGTGAFAASTSSPEMAWLIDSGASSHMTQNRALLVNYQELRKPEKVSLGDGRTVEAIGNGSIELNMIVLKIRIRQH